MQHCTLGNDIALMNNLFSPVAYILFYLFIFVEVLLG